MQITVYLNLDNVKLQLAGYYEPPTWVPLTIVIALVTGSASLYLLVLSYRELEAVGLVTNRRIRITYLVGSLASEYYVVPSYLEQFFYEKGIEIYVPTGMVGLVAIFSAPVYGILLLTISRQITGKVKTVLSLLGAAFILSITVLYPYFVSSGVSAAVFFILAYMSKSTIVSSGEGELYPVGTGV